MVDDDIAGGAGNPLKPAMSSVIDQISRQCPVLFHPQNFMMILLLSLLSIHSKTP